MEIVCSRKRQCGYLGFRCTNTISFLGATVQKINTTGLKDRDLKRKIMLLSNLGTAALPQQKLK